MQGGAGRVAIKVIGPIIDLDNGGWLECLGFDQSVVGVGEVAEAWGLCPVRGREKLRRSMQTRISLAAMLCWRVFFIMILLY